ncbi:hypothetical protein LCGC14_1655620 [marine sediment metagenome]|uniref:Uncharacterized protein n=1 Tax=marine sediment metagenome TaxID=412755 RepID=A0A0F9II34_9ZZZZ
MELIQLLKMFGDEERNQKIAETLQAHQEAILLQNKLILALGIISIVFVLLTLYNEICSHRKFKKIKADISRLDSMISTKSDV